MMPLERRNEPQMLRQFSKMYPSYNLNPLLRRRHQQLLEAQSFNQWLSNRRLRQEGETYADELGRVLVRYDPLSHTVLSYLCEVVQRASERSYLGKEASR